MEIGKSDIVMLWSKIWEKKKKNNLENVAIVSHSA